MLKVRVSCPQCKAGCQVAQAALGQAVRCPRCGVVFRPGSNGNGAAHARSREARTAEAPSENAIAELSQGEEKARPLSLERVPWAWVDRLLPASPARFLLAVALLAVFVWSIGLGLANDRGAFLSSPEWQVQPVFLAVHFICLRLFVTCYTRNFLAAASHTVMPTETAVRWVKRIAGPLGGGLALAAAIPLCISNYFYLHGEVYRQTAPYDGDAVPAACSYFLWSIWCLEWLLNAYIWVLLAGFSSLTIATLRRYPFRSSVEVLLHEKHYRPFLMMSAQGASIVLLFGVVNGFYVWYADGELSDYIGLGITGTLLLMGFAPPWLQLKYSVEKAVDRDTYAMQQKLVDGMSHRAANPDGPVTAAELGRRLDLALAILRSNYLDRMHAELGRAEGKAILLKLLVPASSVAWKFARPWLGM